MGKKGASQGDPNATSDVTEVIPTGIAVIDDWVLGCGGFPCGRMVELYADEGGGKSSIVLAAAARCQAAGGVFVLADTERTVTRERMAVFGVDFDKTLFLSGDTVEKVLKSFEATIGALPAGAGPVLLVWDSLAATATEAEAENGLLGTEMASDRAKTLSRACRVLTGRIAGGRVALVIVNQTRVKFGVSFGGDNTTTPGGKAIKFHASARLQILGGAAIKGAAGVHLGKDVTVMATKNKLAAPWRKARVRMWYAQGYDNEWSALHLAKALGLVPKGSRDNAGALGAIQEAAASGWAGLNAAEGDDGDDNGDSGFE